MSLKRVLAEADRKGYDKAMGVAQDFFLKLPLWDEASAVIEAPILHVSAPFPSRCHDHEPQPPHYSSGSQGELGSLLIDELISPVSARLRLVVRNFSVSTGKIRNTYVLVHT